MTDKITNLSDINAFVVLAETGSFTKASEKLHCSRSHVSKQLAKLEQELGTRLLVRTTRSQYLTPQGEVFFERCKSSLSVITMAMDHVVESKALPVGHIKINCVGGYIGENVISTLVNDFMAKFPEISIELDFTSKRVDLIGGEFDFVFRMGELVDSALIARKLTNIAINAFASKDYLRVSGQPETPKDLSQHRCISGSMRLWSFVSRINDQKVEVSIDGTLTSKNGRVMVSAAVAGNGIIRVPELYCHDELSKQLLVPVFNDWYVESSPFYLVYVKDKYQPLRLSVFKDFVIENFERYML